MQSYKLITTEGTLLFKWYNSKGIGHQLPVLLKKSTSITICDIRESMLARFPWLYDVESGSNIYILEGLEATELCPISEILTIAEEQHWVDYAEGTGLDNIGSLVGCVRREDETDSSLRTRIKSMVALLKGGGTIPALKQAIAPILGLLESEISINDGYTRNHGSGDHYGHFNVTIINHDVTNIPKEDWDYAEALIQNKKAAGVVFDNFSNFMSNDIRIDLIGGNFHVTGLTKTGSLNITTAVGAWK